MVDENFIKKACLEATVIVGLVVFGLLSYTKGDTTNAAWAFGLAGGYVFKNGVTSSKSDKK